MILSFQNTYKFNAVNVDIRNIISDLLDLRGIECYEANVEELIKHSNKSVRIKYDLIRNGRRIAKQFSGGYRNFFECDDINCLELASAAAVPGDIELLISLPTPTLQKPFVYIVNDVESLNKYIEKLKCLNGDSGIQKILTHSLCLRIFATSQLVKEQFKQFLRENNINANVEDLYIDVNCSDGQYNLLIELEECLIDDDLEAINNIALLYSDRLNLKFIGPYSVISKTILKLNNLCQFSPIKFQLYENLNLSKLWVNDVIAADYLLSIGRNKTILFKVRNMFGKKSVCEKFENIDLNKVFEQIILNVEFKAKNNINESNNYAPGVTKKFKQTIAELNQFVHINPARSLKYGHDNNIINKLTAKPFYYVIPRLIGKSISNLSYEHFKLEHVPIGVFGIGSNKVEINLLRTNGFDILYDPFLVHDYFYNDSSIVYDLSSLNEFLRTSFIVNSKKMLIERYINHNKNKCLVRSGLKNIKIDIEIIGKSGDFNILRVDHLFLRHKRGTGEFPIIDFYMNVNNFADRVVLIPGLLTNEII